MFAIALRVLGCLVSWKERLEGKGRRRPTLYFTYGDGDGITFLFAIASFLPSIQNFSPDWLKHPGKSIRVLISAHLSILILFDLPIRISLFPLYFLLRLTTILYTGRTDWCTAKSTRILLSHYHLSCLLLVISFFLRRTSQPYLITPQAFPLNLFCFTEEAYSSFFPSTITHHAVIPSLKRMDYITDGLNLLPCQ
jgi:hypothetical protein